MHSGTSDHIQQRLYIALTVTFGAADRTMESCAFAHTDPKTVP
ncbi:hypothetical protein Natpe_1406 [Natrinema pellirubrum DSM 15624]|uniref:Uncharacterized protein n=1 Tax=Natrinema pellirubrum (strain DSM 15624 / CIP 106293 / JCM 10476 / NCIMB 786 / 157) TaxID=797303 RepID=L0JIH9_NATP1|nr:hypothetical protein Natpe_1406 [Natrinema pellirubrum DSM 15624]